MGAASTSYATTARPAWAARWPVRRVSSSVACGSRRTTGTSTGSFRGAGGVLVNEVPTFRVDNYPYGGTKDSGLGREGVRWAVEELTEPRTLIVRSPPG